MGIDVDAQGDAANLPRSGELLHHSPRRRDRRLALGRLHEQLPPVTAADAKARRRTEQGGAVWKRRRDPVVGEPRGGLRPLGLRCRQLEAHELREGRVAERATQLELAGEESLRVVGGGVADRRRIGGKRLDEDAASARPATAAARELRH